MSQGESKNNGAVGGGRGALKRGGGVFCLLPVQVKPRVRGLKGTSQGVLHGSSELGRHGTLVSNSGLNNLQGK